MFVRCMINGKKLYGISTISQSQSFLSVSTSSKRFNKPINKPIIEPDYYQPSGFTQSTKRSKSFLAVPPTPFQEYCQKVGLTTGKFLGLTALSGASTIGVGSLMVTAFSEVAPTIGGATVLGAFAGSLYHVYKLGKPMSDEQRLYHGYWMHGLMGITIAPSLIVFHQFIPHALITTAALTAGPITAAYRMPKGAMLPYGSALYTGLWGLIGVGVTSLLAPLLGFHGLGMMMHNIDLYAGVALFSVYNAYDTHVMIDNYEKGERDYIGHAVNYSLNAINIFVRMLEIFSKMYGSKKN
jgi:FtsH-binding integral membrane protein